MSAGVLLVGTALAFASATSAHASEVVVVKTGENAVYGKVEAAFLEELGRSARRVGKPDPSDVRDATHGAQVVFAIGPGAAKVVNDIAPATATIFAVVPSPESVGLQSSARIIPMFVPSSHLRTAASLLPKARRVGVLYDPRFSEQMLRECRSAASGLGLTIIDEKVSSEKEVPSAIRGLLGKIDVLWVVPDPTVSARAETFEFIIRTAMEMKVPVVGFSEQASRKGAVLSVQANIPDMGRRAAVLAKRMLAGERVGVEQPAAEVYLNARSAEQLGISIPESLRRQATRVVE